MFARLLVKLLRGSRGRLSVALIAVISGAAVISALLNLDLDIERKLTQEFRLLGANLVLSGKSGSASSAAAAAEEAAAAAAAAAEEAAAAAGAGAAAAAAAAAEAAAAPAAAGVVGSTRARRWRTPLRATPATARRRPEAAPDARAT